VPRDRSRRVREISPHTGIRSLDHTAVASRYTGWAVAARFNKDNEL
jgi:hypothetical protein